MKKEKKPEPGSYKDPGFIDNARNKNLPLGAKAVKRSSDTIRNAYPGPGQYETPKAAQTHKRVPSTEFKRLKP